MDLIINNLTEAIVQTKSKLKQHLPDLKGIFKDVESYIAEEVTIIETLINEEKSVIPEILYKDLDAENIDTKTMDLGKKQMGFVPW